MKTVILAGGVGSRLAEQTDIRPKPMVEVGGRPLLWHIMKLFAYHGHTDFIIALGYLGDVVKRYFRDYSFINSDLTVNLGTGEYMRHEIGVDAWTVSLIDTGLRTLTGGRINRLKTHLASGTFLLTYGDGVSDVDIRKLVAFHRSHGRLATVTAVRPPARFGGLVFDGDQVIEFTEKPQVGEGWINGGFFVLEPDIFDFLENDQTVWEHHPLEHLAQTGQLMAYKHEGYWQCVDNVRDLQLLENLYRTDSAPWMVWKDQAASS